MNRTRPDLPVGMAGKMVMVRVLERSYPVPCSGLYNAAERGYGEDTTSVGRTSDAERRLRHA